MIEREAIGNSTASIVPGDVESVEPEPLHHRDAIARHRAFGVRFVVVRSRRLRALAVSTQIHCHHRELAREAPRDQVPHHMRLRMPVQEEERRATPAVPDADGRLARVDALELESFEHRAETSRGSGRGISRVLRVLVRGFAAPGGRNSFPLRVRAALRLGAASARQR